MQTNEEVKTLSYEVDNTVIKLPQVQIIRQSSTSSRKNRPDSVILSDAALNVSKHSFGTHRLNENL